MNGFSMTFVEFLWSETDNGIYAVSGRNAGPPRVLGRGSFSGHHRSQSSFGGLGSCSPEGCRAQCFDRGVVFLDDRLSFNRFRGRVFGSSVDPSPEAPRFSARICGTHPSAPPLVRCRRYRGPFRSGLPSNPFSSLGGGADPIRTQSSVLPDPFPIRGRLDRRPRLVHRCRVFLSIRGRPRCLSFSGYASVLQVRDHP